MAPALQVAALSSKKLSILAGPPDFGKEVFSGAQGTIFEFAPSGDRFVQCDGLAICLYESSSSPPVKCAAQAPVARIFLSPTGVTVFFAETRDVQQLWLGSAAASHRERGPPSLSLIHI